MVRKAPILDPNKKKPDRVRQFIEGFLKRNRRASFDFFVKTHGLTYNYPDLSWHFTYELEDIYTQHSHEHFRIDISGRDLHNVRLKDIRVEKYSVGDSSMPKPFKEWVMSYDVGCKARRASWQEWLVYRGEPFRFMDFPIEIRYSIYEHVIGPRVWPRLNSGDKNPAAYFDTSTYYFFKRYAFGYPPDPYALAPWAGLLLASKMVNAELPKIVWESTTKHFTVVNLTPAVINHVAVGVSFNALNRISLGLDNTEYCHLLGIEVDKGEDTMRINTTKERVYINTLGKLPNLIHLHFYFLQSREKDGNTAVACQKAIVDWFFTIAYKSIRHIPRVTFSGDVKNSTMIKWGSIFDKAPSSRARHDMTQAAADILSTLLQNVPPPCFCPTTCHWWKLHGPYPQGYDPKTHQRFSCED